MGRRRGTRPAGVEPEQAATIEHAIDRLEDRLMSSPPGLHRPGPTATEAQCQQAGLPPTAAMLWCRFDGLELGAEMARLLPLAEIPSATAHAQEQGMIAPGELVVGERGRDLLVLPLDPWEEGADVILVDELGQRLPEASTAAHLALGLAGEAGVLFDDDGEFRDNLYGEDGELTGAAHRRLLRRRLDLDPDAPRPRLDLARRLLADGELRGASSELRQVLRRAPELCWAHEAMAEVYRALDRSPDACRSYRRAGELSTSAGDPAAGAYFFAQAARWAEADERAELLARVQSARPGFAAEQVEAARALIDRDARSEAAEVVALGLCVSPGQVELLALRQQLEAPPTDD